MYKNDDRIAKLFEMRTTPVLIASEMFISINKLWNGIDSNGINWGGKIVLLLFSIEILGSFWDGM